MTLLANSKSHIQIEEDTLEYHVTPAPVQRRILPKKAPSETVEDYKSAYSHGLEAIYALENIDPNSIRRISIPAKNVVKAPEKPVKQYGKEELPFGGEFQGYINSFITREPIQVLGLMRHAEKWLIDQGKTTLGDLIQFNFKELILVKGLGQGHVDEIESKLARYLDRKEYQQTETLQFSSWLKSLTVGVERKKAAVLLHAFELPETMPLSLAESVEVNRLTHAQKEEWVLEATQQLQRHDLRQQIFKDLELIGTTFLKQWIRQRLGLATSEEIIERLSRIGDQKATAVSTLDLISFVYFDRRFPLEACLIPTDKNIYSVDTQTVELFHAVVQIAETYFYNAQVCYNLVQLSAWIERELAKRWIGTPEGFIEKSLRLSSKFLVSKGKEGILTVRLA